MVSMGNCRPESAQEISVYGYVETVYDLQGNMKKVWHPGRIIKAVPWDIPVVGYNGQLSERVTFMGKSCQRFLQLGRI